jgi:hypothetical protein
MVLNRAFSNLRSQTETAMRGTDDGPAEVRSGSRTQERDERLISPAARRALAEAEARRAQREPERPREVDGRGGRDPVRYGDWEVKGIASDF